MNYYSTNNKQLKHSFRNAVMKGLASDKGLFMPEYIPQLGNGIIENLHQLNFHELALEIVKPFISNDIPEDKLYSIIKDAFNFEIPLLNVHDNIYSLELFHGPTCAFKDVGARFLSRCMSYFAENENETLNILVATSGDTGSAVANAFYKMNGIRVVILYPEGKVSDLQEKQLTTLGENIIALEVAGTFDDCQYLVKEAFNDQIVNSKLKLSSANSINIARLIPQSIYYFSALKHLDYENRNIVFSVPSGNLGNLTAGLMAKKMGLPVNKFISATNINDIVPEYLETGIFSPRKSLKTLSNAMDVGNPSNFERILDIFNHDHNKITENISGFSLDDKQTLKTIEDINKKYNYVLDPHGAVGYAALNNYDLDKDDIGIFLETAHPGKFITDLSTHLNIHITIPDRLKSSMLKSKKTITMSNKFKDFKEFLLS